MAAVLGGVSGCRSLLGFPPVYAVWISDLYSIPLGKYSLIYAEGITCIATNSIPLAKYSGYYVFFLLSLSFFIFVPYRDILLWTFVRFIVNRDTAFELLVLHMTESCVIMYILI